MMAGQTLTLSDLVGEIKREIEALNARASENRREAERCAGTADAYLLTGWTLALELEVNRLTAILAKYEEREESQ